MTKGGKGMERNEVLEMEDMIGSLKVNVYIKTDEAGNVTAVNSDIFIEDTASWINIDSGIGDRFAHAQGSYFEKPLMNQRGIYQYKFENGNVREKTEAEIEAEASALPKPQPTEMELLKAQIAALTERNEFLEDCLAEMAAEVYQ